MRIILITLFCLCINQFTLAQAFFFPEPPTVPAGTKTLTIKTVDRCYTKNVQPKVSEKYFFDENGHYTKHLYIDSGKAVGKQLYQYANNLVVGYQNYSSWTGYADGETSTWDSTQLSNELKYEYANGKIIAVKDYNSFPEMDKPLLSFEINYQYTNAGVLSRETSKVYYDSIDNDLQNIHYALLHVKEYSYKDTVTTIRYYANGKLSATEIIINNKGGKPLKTELRSVTGKLLKKTATKYDAGMNPVQLLTTDTGYDGFGQTYDVSGGDKILYVYDPSGKLLRRDIFYNGKNCITETFIYD